MAGGAALQAAPPASRIDETLVRSLTWDALAQLHASLSGDARLRLEDLADKRQADEQWEEWDRRLTEAEPTEPPKPANVLPCPMKEWAYEQFLEYEALQYDRAVIATNGNLLNERGRRAGIDSRTLFRGPAVRVMAYASDELCSFFGQNGRLGIRAFRWTLFRWASDYKDWLNAAALSFGHVPHIDQPTW